MEGSAVRAAVGWQSDEGLSSLAYKAEHYVFNTLQQVFPEGSAMFQADDHSLVAFTLEGHTFLFLIKVTPKPELLPPTMFVETVERLERHTLDHVILFTNYFLPTTMVAKLKERGLEVFSFDLQESVGELERRLIKLLARWYR